MEFFIPLRNKIEHRHIPQLDGAIFGECQALLLNFDALLGQQFGARHQLRESLSFSLQMFPNGESFAQAVRGNKSLAEIKRFIEEYRATLSADALASSQYAFKAFLIQVANHNSPEALPIQFVQYDKLSPEQKADLERFAVMIKLKPASVVNTGLLKPGAVVKAVQKALGNPKVSRRGGQGDKFTQDTHQRCWRAFGVRPAGDSELPGATNETYCIYDEPHKDYLYTPAWVFYLAEKMSNEEEYEALYKTNK